MEHTLAVSHFVIFFLNGLEIHGGRVVHACKKVPNMAGGVASKPHSERRQTAYIPLPEI